MSSRSVFVPFLFFCRSEFLGFAEVRAVFSSVYAMSVGHVINIYPFFIASTDEFARSLERSGTAHVATVMSWAFVAKIIIEGDNCSMQIYIRDSQKAGTFPSLIAHASIVKAAVAFHAIIRSSLHHRARV